VSYRGPDDQRIQDQLRVLQFYASEPVTWRQWIGVSTGSGSAYAAGAGESACYRDQTISAMFFLPRTWEARSHEEQTPGGTLIAGEVLASTFHLLGEQDLVIWRGLPYTVASESIPLHIAGQVWYRTMLRRGE